MPRSSKPRKQYKPKPIGRPIMGKMRDDLVLPAYSALEVLIKSDDSTALESARHSLCALFDYTLQALQNAGRDASLMVAALDAIQSIDDRYKRLGTYRPAGQELARLRAAVVHADQDVLGCRRTHHVQRACLEVDAALAKVA